MIYKANVQKVYFDFHQILQMYLQTLREITLKIIMFFRREFWLSYTPFDHGAQTHRGRTIMLPNPILNNATHIQNLEGNERVLLASVPQ